MTCEGSFENPFQIELPRDMTGPLTPDVRTAHRLPTRRPPLAAVHTLVALDHGTRVGTKIKYS